LPDQRPSKLSLGTVVKSDPPENTEVDADSTVAYWTAPGKNAVPDVRGMTTDTASTKLASEGFRLGKISEQLKETEAGLIEFSNPAQGTVAELNSPVAVIVNSDQYPIPYVIGSSPQQAEKVLQEAGFRFAEESNFSPAMPGRVLKQYPTDRARHGTVVTLTYSKFYLIVLILVVATGAGVTLLPPHVTLLPDWKVELGTGSPEVNIPAGGPELGIDVIVTPDPPPGEISVTITKET
jgi:beta-lactam-binding protein with PASTA domain